MIKLNQWYEPQGKLRTLFHHKRWGTCPSSRRVIPSLLVRQSGTRRRIKNNGLVFLLFFVSLNFLPNKLFAYQNENINCKNKISNTEADTSNLSGSYHTGIYSDLFKELLGKSDVEVKEKVDSAFQQLFFGNNITQRVYYPVGSDMGYIEDIYNKDVRTEGMSYGMMIAVQLNKQDIFNRLWKWATTYMQFKSGQHKDFLAWHCKTNGAILDSNSASDGEQWFVMSLFFASARWGNGKGIYNYKFQAQKILNAMLSKKDSSDSKYVVTNMFNKKEKLVVFVPVGNADSFTDPSYQLPHYYELWSKWSDTNKSFWREAVTASRKFLKNTANPVTGLTPEYAHFNGTPVNFWGGGKNNFMYDAWRVAMNVAVDYEWFAQDKWEVNECNKLLNFFYSKGINDYGNLYTLEGKELGRDHSTGLVAMNAVACLASTNSNRKDFVRQLWNTPIPTGHYRYYDGMLYMLGMLQVSGNFRIYKLK